MCKEALTLDENPRWGALNLRHIGDERLNIDTTAERLCVDRQTFFRDISLAMEDLAELLFNIDAIGARKNKKRPLQEAIEGPTGAVWPSRRNGL